MKPKQLLAIVFFAVAAGLLIWWIAAGHHPFTTTQTMISVPATDPLFGTTVMTRKWVNQFTPGLEMIGPVSVVLIGLGSWLLVLSNRKKKAAA